MRPHAAAALFAITLALSACDDDIYEFSFEWADKVHAVSPDRLRVAYVQDGYKNSTDVNVSFHQNGACALVAEFRGTRVPLKLQWADSTTLEIFYPKDVLQSDCPADLRDDNGIVDAWGAKVRVLLFPI